jgi:hypothetical protein
VYGRQPTQRVSALGAFQPKRKKGWNPTGFIPRSPSLTKWLHLLEPSRPGLEWTSSHQCSSSGWGCSRHFGDELKTYPLPSPRDFSAPFSAPKFSPPTYFPPSYLPRPYTSLTSFPTHSISRAWESSQAWVAQSRETQGWKKVESSTLKECGKEKARGVLHPKCKSERRKVSSLFSLHVFSSLWFFFFVFFFLSFA